MADKKYIVTYDYGFGVGVSSYSPRETFFVSTIKICSGSAYNVLKEFDTGMRPITLPKKDYNSRHQDIQQPLFIVEENGVLKEYFTGTVLKFVKDIPTQTTIQINGGDPRSVGLREFVVFSNSLNGFGDGISEHRECCVLPKQIWSKCLALFLIGNSGGFEFDKHDATHEATPCHIPQENNNDDGKTPNRQF